MVNLRRGRAESDFSLACLTCNKNLGEKDDDHDRWRPGKIVTHCEGSTVTHCSKLGKPHHTQFSWPACWSCQQPLGCPKCTASVVTEVLCERCLVWGSLPAFLQNGPLTNHPLQLQKRGGQQAPTLSAYPTLWQHRYRRSESQFREDLPTPHTERGKTVMAAMLDALKKGEHVPYEDMIIAAWELPRRTA